MCVFDMLGPVSSGRSRSRYMSMYGADRAELFILCDSADFFNAKKLSRFQRVPFSKCLFPPEINEALPIYKSPRKISERRGFA